jgi:alpha-mannosidase
LAAPGTHAVPGHRFADLSEHGFGVALLTDCKYGYSTYENRMRISLLRSPTYPDPEAGMGRHRFAYAVMPDAGGWRDAGVVAEAAASKRRCAGATAESRPGRGSRWTIPTSCWTRSSGRRSPTPSRCGSTRPTARGWARVRVGLPFTRATRANLLEDEEAEVAVTGDEIAVDYRPQQIVTVLVP